MRAAVELMKGCDRYLDAAGMTFGLMSHDDQGRMLIDGYLVDE